MERVQANNYINIFLICQSLCSVLEEYKDKQKIVSVFKEMLGLVGETHMPTAITQVQTTVSHAVKVCKRQKDPEAETCGGFLRRCHGSYPAQETRMTEQGFQVGGAMDDPRQTLRD